MKILLVHNYYKYKGGEDLYVLSLAKLLRGKGHVVTEYFKDSNVIPNSFVGKLQLIVNLLFSVKVKREFSSLVKKNKPDIVHVNNVYPLITPYVYDVCHKNNIPVVQTIHNYRLICSGGYLFKDGRECKHNRHKDTFSYLFHNCYRNSYVASFIYSGSIFWYKLNGSYNYINAFLFPGKFVKDIHKKMLGMPKSKYEVLRYFIEKGNTIKVSEGNYFLFVGRLSPEKGILELLNLFSKIPEKKLIVIGDGPLKSEVLHYRKYKNITILQNQPHGKILGYMKYAVATIIPSKWYETGPIVMIESFSVGTPVIVPKIGVFKENVIEGRNGFFFEFNNMESLGNIIKKPNFILRKEEIIKEYKRKYTSEVHYKQLIKVYKALSK